MLGIAGIYLCYQSTKIEDKLLIEKFGDEYREYMERIPAMNFIEGTIRLLRRRKKG
jgi:protein-S-isoprenylcysteine O-methyltransferase Ste14